MQNYAEGTIVPVGTKIVFTGQSGILKTGKPYTVIYQDCNSDIYLEGVKMQAYYWSIENFAPYIEEQKKVSLESVVAKEGSTVSLQWDTPLPTYITLKFIPGVSKGSVIVNGTEQGKGIRVMQYDRKFPDDISLDHKDNVRWLLKEHPEDFKKIN